MVRRLRPLAQQTVDAELARAMRTFATRHLEQHLSAEGPFTPRLVEPPPVPVALPARTISAVESLVGRKDTASFIAAATEREVQTRALDALAPSSPKGTIVDQMG